jgi:hypothetical protein
MNTLLRLSPLVGLLALACATEPITDSTTPGSPGTPADDARTSVEAGAAKRLLTGRLAVDGRALALEHITNALSLTAYAGASAPELATHLAGVLRADGTEISLRVAIPAGTKKLLGLSAALGRDSRGTHATLEQDGRSFQSEQGTVTVTKVGVLGVEMRIDGGRFTELGGSATRSVDATFRTPLRIQCFVAADIPGMVSAEGSPTWVPGPSDHALCKEMAQLL